MKAGLLRGFLSIAVGKGGVLALSILITPILVRLLGSEGYGDYAFVMSAAALLTTLTGRGGVTSGVRKYIVEERDIPKWKSTIFAFYLQIGLILILLVSIGISLYTVSGLPTVHFGEGYGTYFYLLILVIGFRHVFSYTKATLMAFSLEHISESFAIVKKTLFGILSIGFVLYLDLGVVGVLAGIIVSTAIVLVGCIAVLSNYISFRHIFRLPPSNFPYGELLSFNLSTIIFLFLLTSLYQVDILMLQPIHGSQQTGFYKAALTTAEFLWFAPHAAQLAMLHSMSSLWADEKDDEITAILTKATRYTLLLTTLLAIGLAALADEFVTLFFGPEFIIATGPLLLLIPGALGFSLTRPILSTIHAKGALRQLIIATGSAATINLVLNAFLIPLYGIYGAAIATSIGYGSMFIFHVWCARKIGLDPISDLRIARFTVPVTVTTVVVFPLTSAITSDLLSLFIVPPVGFVVFLGTAIISGMIATEDLNRIQRRLPTIFSFQRQFK